MYTPALTDQQMQIIRSALEAYLEQETEYYQSNFESFVAVVKISKAEKNFQNQMQSFIDDGHRIGAIKELLRIFPVSRREMVPLHDVEM